MPNPWWIPKADFDPISPMDPGIMPNYTFGCGDVNMSFEYMTDAVTNAWFLAVQMRIQQDETTVLTPQLECLSDRFVVARCDILL